MDKMTDLISRQEAIEALEDAGMTNYQSTGDFHGIINALTVIKNLPTFEPDAGMCWGCNCPKMPDAEKKGKWEEKQDNDWAGGGAWVCSECGFGYAFGAYHEAYEFNYCPNCGARMEESE